MGPMGPTGVLNAVTSPDHFACRGARREGEGGAGRSGGALLGRGRSERRRSGDSGGSGAREGGVRGGENRRAEADGGGGGGGAEGCCVRCGPHAGGGECGCSGCEVSRGAGGRRFVGCQRCQQTVNSIVTRSSKARGVASEERTASTRLLARNVHGLSRHAEPCRSVAAAPVRGRVANESLAFVPLVTESRLPSFPCCGRSSGGMISPAAAIEIHACAPAAPRVATGPTRRSGHRPVSAAPRAIPALLVVSRRVLIEP